LLKFVVYWARFIILFAMFGQLPNIRYRRELTASWYRIFFSISSSSLSFLLSVANVSPGIFNRLQLYSLNYLIIVSIYHGWLRYIVYLLQFLVTLIPNMKNTWSWSVILYSVVSRCIRFLFSVMIISSAHMLISVILSESCL
jgi:hypothetical protein